MLHKLQWVHVRHLWFVLLWTLLFCCSQTWNEVLLSAASAANKNETTPTSSTNGENPVPSKPSEDDKSEAEEDTDGEGGNDAQDTNAPILLTTPQQYSTLSTNLEGPSGFEPGEICNFESAIVELHYFLDAGRVIQILRPGRPPLLMERKPYGHNYRKPSIRSAKTERVFSSSNLKLISWRSSSDSWSRRSPKPKSSCKRCNWNLSKQRPQSGTTLA